ncbi:indole-3-glycerol-phosphate synthase [Halobaculum sp. MBLA0143]|uniref:indole-3-glycerol-phosphate synthase n=1 Tax=Halobaculum sp. MBLA0143 TaxID=3079933 RepID=UPI003524C22F
MNTSRDLAPAVASILAATADRDHGEGAGRVADARSLPEAVAATEADGRVPVVAEVKPTSPTTDGTREADPAALAEAMVAGGATGISVLTEPDHFGGSVDALRAVRSAVDVPVLRKDFLLRESQLDAVAADLVLLIARFLGPEPDAAGHGADDLATMVAAARDRGMEPLVEVHTPAELSAAVEAGASVIGVNNRDLAALEVDLGTFERVAPDAPEDVTLLAESGLSTATDAERMRAAGADALLIGSAVVDGVEAATDETAARELVTDNTRRFTTAEAETTDVTDTRGDR